MKRCLKSGWILMAWMAVACQNATSSGSEWRPVIIDHAGIIQKTGQDSLALLIRQIRNETGAELAIYATTSLQGKTLEEFSLLKANQIGIGRISHNDGILIVVITHEKKARIEVGEGLENILLDEIVSRYMHEIIGPNFRMAKFSRGLYVTGDRIRELLVANKGRIGERPLYLQRWDSITKAHRETQLNKNETKDD